MEAVAVNKKTFIEFIVEGGYPFINIYDTEIKNIYDLKKEKKDKKKATPKEEKDLIAKKQRQYFQYINIAND